MRKILIIVLVCVLAISIFNIVKITHDYKTADTVNKSLQEQFIKPNNIEPSIDPIPEEKITIPISVDFEALKRRMTILWDGYIVLTHQSIIRWLKVKIILNTLEQILTVNI